MPTSTETARDLIVAAAVSVFGRFGYRKTTMDLLANAAGVPRPAVNRHFPNKTAVFHAAAAHAGAELQAAAEAAAGRPGNTADRLHGVLTVKLDAAAGDPRHRLIHEAAVIAPEVVAETESAYLALLATVLAEADDLDLPAAGMSANEAAALLTDAMLGLARAADTAATARHRLRRLVDLAVRGLAAAPVDTGR